MGIETIEPHLTSHIGIIGRNARRERNGHGSLIVWFTGLSGSGKSTLAYRLEERLFHRSITTYVLDGDNIRMGLNKDLGFSAADREENIRRIGETAKILMDAGIIAITSFISPYRKDRQGVRKMVEKEEFVEIYVKCPLQVCRARDVKGLYAKAEQGIITNFTGIGDIYEEPEHPELVIETDNTGIDEGVEKVLVYLERTGSIPILGGA
ncbi:MAG TPA: adenylyl-sulfate kinase [Syntrophorhabdaceae bacterium]|jgi:adenylylsulfate kinase